VAVVSVDPTRKRTGGALLGDRIRFNSLKNEHAYMRSLATRASSGEMPAAVKPVLDVCRAYGFDLILVETAGIGRATARSPRSPTSRYMS